MANTRIPIFNADAQTAYIDFEQDATDGDGRQVIVIGSPSVKAAVAEVKSVDPGTGSTDYGQVVRVAGSIQVGGYSGSAYLTGIYNSIAVHLLSTGGTIAANVGKVDGTVAVFFSPANPGVNITSGTLTGITNSIAIHLLSTGGSLVVKLDPSYNVVNASSTISLPVTVSSTTSGVSASGVQVVAPETGHNTKVFAYSVQTTGAVSMAVKFTNGAGTSPTEFWRPLATASSVTGVQGANLAVAPPGYLFATGVNTTLAIVNDTASLIHYSVSYFKESA